VGLLFKGPATSEKGDVEPSQAALAAALRDELFDSLVERRVEVFKRGLFPNKDFHRAVNARFFIGRLH